MQRTEYELQKESDNLCLMFFDSINSKENNFLLESYNQICSEGGFIERYHHIKDSLNIVLSHHSIGIQIADLISGAFNGAMKDYGYSRKIFDEKIKTHLRNRNYDTKIMGYGIIEVPSNEDIRNSIRTKLDLE